MATTEAEKNSGRPVDPDEEPSVDWGWHGGFPRAIQVYGWFTVFALLMMLIGNHQGILSGGDTFKTADFYLIGFAAVIATMLIVNLRKRRKSWRR